MIQTTLMCNKLQGQLFKPGTLDHKSRKIYGRVLRGSTDGFPVRENQPSHTEFSISLTCFVSSSPSYCLLLLHTDKPENDESTMLMQEKISSRLNATVQKSHAGELVISVLDAKSGQMVPYTLHLNALNLAVDWSMSCKLMKCYSLHVGFMLRIIRDNFDSLVGKTALELTDLHITGTLRRQMGAEAAAERKRRTVIYETNNHSPLDTATERNKKNAAISEKVAAEMVIWSRGDVDRLPNVQIDEPLQMMTTPMHYCTFFSDLCRTFANEC